MLWIGKKGIYSWKKSGRVGFLKYGKRNYNYGRRRSPYSVQTLGADGHSVEYLATNRRTGWKKYFTRFDFDGGKRPYWGR